MWAQLGGWVAGDLLFFCREDDVFGETSDTNCNGPGGCVVTLDAWTHTHSL